MRKIVLVLAVLMLATPVMAGVTVKLTQWLGGPGLDDKAVIRYEMNGGDTNDIRAFAFDIDVNCSTCYDTSDVTTMTVESSDPNYWVYPGSIDINEWTGEIRDVGSPIVADGNYPGTLTLADDNGVTIEMASLYGGGVGSSNSPDPCSVLLTFSLDKSCWLRISENTTRGGVVYEDGNSATVTLTANKLKYLNAYGDMTSRVSGSYAGAKDGKVNSQDYAMLAGNWLYGTGTYPALTELRADLTSRISGKYAGAPDGKVNSQDYAALAGNWDTKRHCNLDPF